MNQKENADLSHYLHFNPFSFLYLIEHTLSEQENLFFLLC
jgi:hypothetical protein